VLVEPIRRDSRATIQMGVCEAEKSTHTIGVKASVVGCSDRDADGRLTRSQTTTAKIEDIYLPRAGHPKNFGEG
jgi:hypothetical protein